LGEDLTNFFLYGEKNEVPLSCKLLQEIPKGGLSASANETVCLVVPLLNPFVDFLFFLMLDEEQCGILSPYLDELPLLLLLRASRILNAYCIL
jgi:hypothetical protein